MERMKRNVIVLLVIMCSASAMAVDPTHWVVTETGLIKPKFDSPFEMARPYDLLAFLNQDTLWENIINDYHDLAQRQVEIDKLWTEVENHTSIDKHLQKHKHCAKAGTLKLIDWYTMIIEPGSSKKVADQDLLFEFDVIRNGPDRDVPDCKKISSLTFSMFAFEHLEGMRTRDNLNMTPDTKLLEHATKIMTLGQFGHWISDSLKKNSTSWLHYKFAAMFWMMKGNAPKAFECCRRALHNAPRTYRDIALVSLGTLLHRTRMSEDAIIVFGAAVDHDPEFYLNHFYLGSALAVIGEFNTSIHHFNRSIQLFPKIKIMKKYRDAAMCHEVVQQIWNSSRKTVKSLRQALGEYLSIEAKWLKSQASLLRSMNHKEEYDYRNIEQNCIKMTELTKLNIKDLKGKGDRNSLHNYFFDDSMYDNFWDEPKGVEVLNSLYNLQKFIKHARKHAKLITETERPPDASLADYILVRTHMHTAMFHEDMVGDFIQFPDESKSQDQNANFNYNTGIVLFPPIMKISRNIEDFDKEASWPTDMFCLNKASTFPANIEGIYPVFLPFENKGIKLTSLLTDRIGYKATEQHELPWHPPNCAVDRDVAALTQKKNQKQPQLGEVLPTPYLRRKLLEYVGDGDAAAVKNMDDAEIGQRIYSAMTMELVPPWLSATLASLYWRVRGNSVSALHCLATASKTVTQQYRDVVMTSLASVYLEMGYFDEALAAVEEAFRLNSYEPATNFVIFELNMIKRHRNTHIFHLKQVVRVDGSFMDGLARNLLDAWACILKQVDNIQEKAEYALGDVCTPIEPGVNMVCEKDGTNCQMTSKKCQHNEKESNLRMINLKDVVKTESSDTIFDSFIANMPKDRRNKTGHYANFRSMMDKIDGTLLGCGPRGCSDIHPEDLDLTEDDCSLQYLQLGYWMHAVFFKQVFSDDKLAFPLEIASLPPSDKKVPQCQSLSDSDIEDDFFLERLYRVDTNDWEPMMSLMHQFAETFDFFDFMSLGSKIQKYLEMQPTSLLGLVAAGWWCSAGGRGGCARRCLAAAAAAAPAHLAAAALRPLAVTLLLQSKKQDAKDIAYLAFYSSPKSKLEAFLVALSHSYLGEYEQAVWMYRYALTFDNGFLPAKACLHASLCLMLFGEKIQPKDT